MILENPTLEQSEKYGYCAIRRRNADGSRNIGGAWLEPMGSTDSFVEDQEHWEVVFYQNPSIDKLPD